MLKEFKEFALRGNVVDLAVGVIVGGAFGKIVTSLVNDIIMPLLGLVVGRIDLTSLKIVLRAANETTSELAITYGRFLQDALDFLIISFSIFMVLRVLNNLHAKLEREREEEEEKEKAAAEPPAPPEPSNEERLLMEIRDLLRERN
ncbi:MAG: large-conductance mechanosensitive channel protein MscL [Firmicutes bacterium]|jgi:large conductance mechanosensitive channel|nr:large-conductance mechanosensitive channel protein MscL [Bacillota bacterium]NLO66529.1 large-conductance mechanosensitive channel protein MscL [Bacillota bacterium]